MPWSRMNRQSLNSNFYIYTLPCFTSEEAVRKTITTCMRPLNTV